MPDIRVHGSIFFLLKKFITKELPANSWDILNEQAGTGLISFSTTENYPIETMNLLLENASEMTGLSRDLLMEQFGTYLVDDLFALYKDYIRPEWRTFYIILHTESVMHGAVRKLNSTANPPILNVFQVNEKLLIIDYFSKRKMASLAIGIIRGISEYYGEADKIKITPMTNPDDERVQIRLDFL
nr:heme NO-binding domain-containing protein [uncultured Flavobacterium sp.]